MRTPSASRHNGTEPRQPTRLTASRYTLPLMAVAIHLLAFALARLALLVCYPEQFRALSAWQVIVIFGRGVLFDASIVFTVAVVPLVCLILPIQFGAAKWWRLVWGWCLYVIFVAFVLLLGADLVYFGFVDRHIGPELVAIGNDLDNIWGYLWDRYLGLLAAVVVVLVGIGWLWNRLVRHPVTVRGKPLRDCCVLVVAVALMVLIIRGGWGRKPLNIVNAFDGTSPAGGYLVLNGPFSAYHSARNASRLDVSFLPLDQAVDEVRNVLHSGQETYLDDAYPLLRRRTESSETRPNVVIILLESWSAQYVDAVRVVDGLEPLGATPCFDALAQQGVLFSRFYANGERSMDGIAAILAGMLSMPSVPYIGKGMENNRLGFLGHMAKHRGYATYFMQASPRTSFRLNAVAHRAGFDEYRGMEDLVPTGHTDKPYKAWGAWDYDLFSAAHELFAAADKPFVGVLFTVSTHGPYLTPGKRWDRLEADTKEHAFLNVLYYSDWALGRFIEKAKQAGYFGRTIFVVVADHTANQFAVGRPVPMQYHVPCLILAPGVEPAVIERVASQVDLLPTIMDLAGWAGPHSTMGRSILDPTTLAPGQAFCVSGPIVTWIEGDAWVQHNLDRRLAFDRGAAGDIDVMERKLLSFVQVGTTLLRRNRVFSDMD